jgi:two-component system, cell cycle response regulator DivK
MLRKRNGKQQRSPRADRDMIPIAGVVPALGLVYAEGGRCLHAAGRDMPGSGTGISGDEAATHGCEILVVEDDPLSAILARDLLISRGHRVRGASDVSHALRELLSARPDLVLLDVQFPGGGAEAVLKVIRNSPSLATLPVVALTALAMSGDRERILALGFDAYLSKPIGIKSFFAVVDSLLPKS